LNLLEENFPKDQRPQLREWHISFRQIGRDFAHSGLQDRDIIPLLHRGRRVTFFTQDDDFFSQALCHPAYCLVFLDVRADDTADFVRRFLRHSRFSVERKRLGLVARVHHDSIEFWQKNHRALQHVDWLRQP